MIPPEAGRFVTWLDEGLGLVPGAEGGANSLLILDDDVILVDAGMSADAAAALAPHVSLLLLTRVDVPHVKEAHRFERVWAPHAEADALASPDAFLQAMGVGARDGAITGSWLTRRGFQPVDVERRYRPHGMLSLPKGEWHLVPAPGPSPGACALHEPGRDILFAGAIGPGPHAPWYGWPASEVDDVEASLNALASLDPDLLLSSHSPPLRRGAKQTLRNLAAVIRQRDARLYDALTPAKSIHDLVSLGLVHGVEEVKADAAVAYFERVMAEQHLNRLLERGLAFARQDGRYQQA